MPAWVPQLTRIAGLLACLLVVVAPAYSQAPAPPAAAITNTLQETRASGFPLAASSNVTGNVSVEAVLIPPKIARHVFGKSVGNDYATIEITISNRSSDASLIVHSLFVDYSKWLLSGYSPGLVCDGQVSAADDKSSQPAGRDCNISDDWQSQNKPNQIASMSDCPFSNARLHFAMPPVTRLL